jgi:PAS domain S-box-containing protein
VPSKSPPSRKAGRAASDRSQDLGACDALLDALPVSLYIVDRDLRIVAWNSGRERGAYGQPRAEVLGRLLRDVIPSSGFRATEPVLRKVLESGVAFEETTESQGQARQFRIRRLPIMHGRTVTHVLSWFEDITEQRALEMQLIASDRLAFLGQLLAGVVHEISNPLASIAGCAEALASLAVASEDRLARKEAVEFRDLIRSEVARSERILRTLLQSVKSDDTPTAAIDATVASVLRLLDHHPAFTRIRVVQRFPAGLPPARIDADSLKQVVIALAVNAAHAMAGGGTLTLRAGQTRQGLVLDVMDTGPGVPAEIRHRIFEPFFTTNAAQGAGLGLAVARTLVRHRGGDLIYRHRRSGAAFRVLLRSA